MSITKRTPDEIMAVIDQAQERLGEDFDLPSLVWEIIGDVIDSAELATMNAVVAHMGDGNSWRCLGGVFGPEGVKQISQGIAYDAQGTIRDYVANHYGDL